MKRLGFILAVSAIAISASFVRAEDEYTYSKLFEEGKVWNIVTEWFDFTTQESHTEYTQASFNKEWSDGNHLFSELNCLNQTSGISFTLSYVEKDRTIYARGPITFRKIIDYNLSLNDPVIIEPSEEPGVDMGFNYFIVKDEIIDIKGTERRILSIAHGQNGTPFTYWIEGIGAIDDLVMLIFPVPTCAPYVQSRRIASCYLNGECIFEYGDLEDYIAKNGVGSIETETPQSSEVEYYNLQGVRVSNPENGIFIVRQGSKTYKVVK